MNFNQEHLQETDRKPTSYQLMAGSVWPQNELKHILPPHLQLIREKFLGKLCKCKIPKAPLIINAQAIICEQVICITDIILSCREQACKGKKPVENGESSNHNETYGSSSDSDNEVLIERIKKARVKARSDTKKGKKCQSASKTSVTTRESENKQTNKFCARQNLQQQGIGSVSACTSTEMQEDDFSNVTFIKPTPQPDKKRSIFTRRQHRSPSTSFEYSEDYAISLTETQRNKSDLTNHQLKAISNHKKSETALVHKRDIKLEMSPLIKKKKRQRMRVMSVSSDSD